MERQPPMSNATSTHPILARLIALVVAALPAACSSSGSASGGAGGSAPTGAAGATSSQSGGGGAVNGGGGAAVGGAAATGGSVGTGGGAAGTMSGAGSGGGGAAGASETGGSAGASAQCGEVGALSWPNADSHTNSDSWLSTHHNQISKLLPKVLIINFLPSTSGDVVLAKAKANAAAIALGSRYHGYRDPNAPVFIEYQFPDHVIDLPGQAPHLANDFDYVTFVTGQNFADELAYKDPADGTKNLTVCQLFERGLVNEVWVAETPSDPNKLYEIKSRAQRYDGNLAKLAGNFDTCASNGCVPAFTCGVTVRLSEINVERGEGCASHAWGHGIEGQVRRSQIPYLTHYATHFFNFDLDKLYGLPFASWYEGPCTYGGAPCVNYVSPTHVQDFPGAMLSPGQKFDIDNYHQGCGNVHWRSNSQVDPDPATDQPAETTCENYGLRNGMGGKDLTDTYREAKSAQYDDDVPDCGGGWATYLRQSMPGCGNQAKDDAGKPMLNWWPFLFY